MFFSSYSFSTYGTLTIIFLWLINITNFIINRKHKYFFYSFNILILFYYFFLSKNPLIIWHNLNCSYYNKPFCYKSLLNMCLDYFQLSFFIISFMMKNCLLDQIWRFMYFIYIFNLTLFRRTVLIWVFNDDITYK